MAASRSEPIVVAGVNSIGYISVVAVHLAFAVNTSPTAVLVYHTGTGVQQIFSGDAAEEIGKIQAVNFQDRVDDDAFVTIADTNNGQNLTFTGLACGPSYSLFAGQLKKSITIASHVALLDSLQFNIYRYDHNDMFSVDKLNTGNSWAERIQAAVDFLVDRGQKNFTDFSGADRERVAIKHNRNVSLGLPILKEILKNSIPTTQSEGLKKLSESADSNLTLNNGIANAILGALMQPSERFWQTLDLLASMFRLIYIPDERYGKFINAAQAIDSEPTEVTVAIHSVDFNDGGGGILPVQQVLVQAASVTTWPRNSDNGGGIIDAWPESPPSSGVDVDLPLPGWLIPADALGPTGKPLPIPVGVPGVNDPLDIASYKGGSNTVVKRVRKAANPIVSQFIREFARNSWVDLAMTRSSVSFSVRMRLAVKPGNRYRVKDGLTGKPLFTGFLHSVQHDVEVASGQTGTEKTTVGFSHVEMGSFTLPGK